MKSMKLAVVFGVGLICCGAAVAQAAQAQSGAPQAAPAVPALPEDQQATKEQIAKLFDVMRLREQMAAMQKMMPQMMQKQAREQEEAILSKLPAGQKPTPEQQQALDKLMGRIMERALGLYPADEIIADATPVYQRHISRVDADAMIAFYNSPAGQHLLDAQPVIMQEYMPLVLARMQERSKAFADETAKEIQEVMQTSSPAKN